MGMVRQGDFRLNEGENKRLDVLHLTLEIRKDNSMTPDAARSTSVETYI